MNAAYFSIVSFSTIGYGDIFPIQTLSKLITVFLCILNLTIMSNFLGRFIEHLFALSPYSKDYDFKDHVVMIGELSDDKRRDFLEELIENDLVERDMNNPMGQLSSGIKCIIVSEEEPSNQMRNEALYYTEKHDNEIVFLKDNIFSQGKTWYRRCNLKEAKILFAFSKESENETEAFEQDKLISLTAKTVKETFARIRVMLVLNTEFKQLIDMDTMYQDIECISPQEMNDFLVATTLENPGLGTTLQHLLTMKSKSMSKDVLQAASQDEFLFSYMRDMQSEIYQVVMPDFFVGMSFRKCAQVLYIHSVTLANDGDLDHNKLIQKEEPITMLNLIAIETSVQENFMTQDDNSFFLNENNKSVGDTIKNTKTPSTQNEQLLRAEDYSPEKRQTSQNSQNLQSTNNQQTNSTKYNNQFLKGLKNTDTQILINPQKYTIRKNDIGFVICDNHELAISIRQINSTQAEKYKQFLANFNQIRKNVGNRKIRKSSIMSMFHQLNLKQKFKTISSQQSLQLDEEVEMKVYDFNDNQYPRRKLENHTIIIGKVNKFPTYLQILRSYTARPIVLFTEDQIPAGKWNEMRSQLPCDTEDCYIFKGKYLNMIHLSQLGIQEAYQIYFSSKLFQDEFPDAIGLCLTHILSDFYEQSNFLLEITQDSNLRFLHQNIRFKQIKGLPSFLQQTFMQGNIHFTSMITGMLARVVYNPSWLRLFQDLTIRKSYEKRQQNQRMNCIRITDDIQSTFGYFGPLQFGLLEMKPSVIAISLIKFKTKQHSKFSRHFLNEFMQNANVPFMEQKFWKLNQLAENIYQYNEDQRQKKFQAYMNRTIGKFIGHKFIFTNPAFYTPLEEGDHVLVLGDLSEAAEDQPEKVHKDNEDEPHLQKELLLDLQDDDESDHYKEQVERFKTLYKDYEQRKKLKDILLEEVKRKKEMCVQLAGGFKSQIKIR